MSGSRRGNSNNWVLAGGRTKGGRPILANDPHLQIEFPPCGTRCILSRPAST